uniref:Uncharacterized protein n=1 Tax=Anguilla anguilla TaxID=7936 RepID=A0A0E9XJG7_ANGAN
MVPYTVYTTRDRRSRSLAAKLEFDSKRN